MKTTYRKSIETDYFSLSAQSIIGDRQEQQDAVYITGEAQKAFGIICDGMGGHSGGKIASELTVNIYAKAYEEENISDSPIKFLNNCANSSNVSVFNLCDANGARLKAGTTLVAFVMEKNQVNFIGIGDSRIYLIRDGKILQLTEDLNYSYKLNLMKKKGAISSETYEMEKATKGEALISFIGLEKIEYRNLTEKPLILRENDRLVLMSDGLYKRISDETICEVAGSFSDTSLAVSALLQQSSKMSKNKNQDNTTLVILKMKEGKI